MFRIETNLNEVCLTYASRLKAVEEGLGHLLTEAAQDGMAAVTHRIQHRGLNTDGQKMQTQSRAALGAYSKAWAKMRRARGRQIGYVDHTNTGDLMRNYQIIYKDARTVIVGFMDAGMNDIASYLEAYFGAAYYLSQAEQKLVLGELTRRVVSQLNAI